MNATTDYILKKHSILEYLERKGHLPFRQLPGGKYSFLCPFSDHNETKPSFMVWTAGQYENFYCFGCQRNFSIVNLVADLEGMSYKQAYAKLADGADISHLEERNHSLKEHEEVMSQGKDNPIYASVMGLEDALIDMSNITRFYTECMKQRECYDKEIEIIDEFWSKIDQKIIDVDFPYVVESPEDLLVAIETRKAKLDIEAL